MTIPAGTFLACSSRRAIQRLIQDPLAMKRLDGEVLPGDTVEVDADLKKDTMTFARATAKTTRGVIGLL